MTAEQFKTVKRRTIEWLQDDLRDAQERLELIESLKTDEYSSPVKKLAREDVRALKLRIQKALRGRGAYDGLSDQKS